MQIRVNVVFYGQKARFTTVLPPEDPRQSDIDYSSSSDEEIDINLANRVQQRQTIPLPTDISIAASDWESEDDVPLINLQTKAKLPNYQWFKADFQHNTIPIEKCFDAPDKIRTPLEYFSYFFDENLYQMIAYETNIYSTLVTGSCIQTNVSEIKAFIAIHLLMGVVNMPSFEDYWSVLMGVVNMPSFEDYWSTPPPPSAFSRYQFGSRRRQNF
ncbi:Transposase IS4 [Popillia japonica]|uniref:Transposase IS4 n=1 Tax=Popillia japonica TaxID=7064 RepID=A0AAW1KHF1_POPJA